MENSKVCIEMGLKQQAWMWVFVLVLIINASFQSGWSEGCLEQERFALLQLKPFFNHPHTLSNWVEGDHNNSDCCQWERVECSNDTTGRVISLDLFYTRGEEMGEWYLNASLFSPFQQLQRLYLDANSIAGCVENEGFDKLSTLSNLQTLDLCDNSFNNSILSSLNLRSSNLKYLDLSGNIFNKNILSSLSALSSLKSLYINDIGLNGSVDLSEMFHSLRNLEVLEIGNNQIHKLVVTTGNGVSSSNLRDLILRNVSIHDGRTLFQSLESFPYLKTVHLEYNNFSGILISNRELHNFTNLKELYMGGSSVHISLLQSIAAFTSLETLNMRDCQLNGILDIKGGLCELVHLRELDLSRNNLKGALPSCFGNLTSLEELDISFNQFSGNISLSPLMALISIQQLKLSYNDFQIPISLEPFSNHSKLKSFSCKNNDLYVEAELYSLAPKFQLNSIRMSGCKGSCTFPKFLYYQHDLLAVDLSHNNFTGVFPGWLLENNRQLLYLVLLNNSLTGPLPLPIHSHMNLTTLDISMNNFSRNILAEVAAYLPGLRFLNISGNALVGNIPSSIGDMNSLLSLDLSHNHLSGEIPQHLAEGCFSLMVLALSNNSLKGQIFSSNFNLTNLRILQLDGNNFHGKIPDSLSNTSLDGLYLSDNQLSGKIPGWLGNMSSLRELVMPNNHFEGPIPLEFCQLEYLEVLNLAGNNISDVPSCFSPLLLKQVHLSRNMLQGQLQDSFRNSSFLVTLDFGYNHINGSIPNWVGKLFNLTYLILNNNNLQGRVPIQLCQLDQLRLIDLSHNNLFGPIPPCLMTRIRDKDFLVPPSGYYEGAVDETFYPLMRTEEIVEFRTKTISYFYHGNILTKMFGIDLSCNKLTGDIPPQIGNLTMIHALNLSHNNLYGSIPSTFSNLKQIESLDLSYNNLSGKIPHQLAELYTLEVFSVAYNNLSGRTLGLVAQFSTFNASSYDGNPLLCGLPLPRSCDAIESPTLLPTDSDGIGEENDFMDMGIFYISFTVSYAIVILTIVVVLFINPYWRQTWFHLVETWMTLCYYFIVDHLPSVI